MRTLSFYQSAVAGILLVLATDANGQPALFPDVHHRADVSVERIELNGDDDEFAVAAIRGGESILYTSSREGASHGAGSQRMWTSRKQASGWSQSQVADGDFAQGVHSGVGTVTPDGNFMIFAASEWEGVGADDAAMGRTDLFSAERIGGRWTNIRNLGPTVNSVAWDSHPSLTADGRTLFFASDRSGGYGGADLYVTTLSAAGWAAPQILGPSVNTPFEEVGPVIAPDGRRLYFSSNGHGGAGGLDIFSVVIGSGELDTGALENIGTPINSAANDYFFVAVPNSQLAYFSSDRSGTLDIFSAMPNPTPPDAMVAVAGRVLEAETGSPLRATITITDLSTRESLAYFNTDSSDGEYYVLLTGGRRYAVTAEAPEHMFYSDEYSVPRSPATGTVRKDITLFAMSGGTTRLLVFFQYNKATLEAESIPDLNRAIELLRANPEVEVEVAGHTDSIGTDAYNLRLSQARADAVRAYMIDNGVRAARVRARGYGEARAVDDNGAEDGRARNRRVEMIVTRAGVPPHRER